jgi:hypothetical protein
MVKDPTEQLDVSSALRGMRVAAIAIAFANPTTFVLDEQLAPLSPCCITGGRDRISLRLKGSRYPRVAFAALRPLVSVTTTHWFLPIRHAFQLGSRALGEWRPRAGCRTAFSLERQFSVVIQRSLRMADCCASRWCHFALPGSITRR